MKYSELINVLLLKEFILGIAEYTTWIYSKYQVILYQIIY